METKTGLLGTGFYVPEKILTNTDLEKLVDTTDEWIRTRSGIEERRIAEDDEHCSDMAVKAAKKAIENSNITKDDIDLVIVATVTGDYILPATASVVQHKLDMGTTPGFDISAACSGFLYAMTISKGLVESGLYQNILIIGVEKFSKTIDWEDRNICVLFADGAGAAVVGKSNDGSEIISSFMGNDGSRAEALCTPAGGSKTPISAEVIEQRLNFMKMDGKEIYRNAVKRMPEALDAAVEKAGVKIEDLDYVIFHQANLRIIQSIAKKYKLPEEKVIVNIQKYGNTSAATIPIALAEAIEQGKIKKGDLVGFSAFGAGLTWAGAVVRI